MPQPFSKMAQLWGGGYYQEFEYMPDEYERKKNFETQLRHQSMEKREQVSNHDWRFASQEKRMKHEAIISDPRNKETYPYLGGDKDAELEGMKNWLRSGASSSRSGPWKQERAQMPAECSFLAGKGRGLEDDSRTSRMTLPTIVLRLQKRVDADWEGTTVVVSATDQDLIQIAFHMETVDSERGVMAYMNVLSKDVDLIGSLGLRKVSQLWGMMRDFSAEMAPEMGQDGEKDSLEHTWMFFLLMPKWVRMRPTDAYYTVHPRSQGSAFRMSTAGSSVLLSLGTSVFDPADGSRRKGDDACTSYARGLARAGVLGSTGGQVAATPSTPRVDLSLIEQAVQMLPKIQEYRRPPG